MSLLYCLVFGGTTKLLQVSIKNVKSITLFFSNNYVPRHDLDS